jgi:hypothetical protein
MRRALVIVACGKSKIWDRDPRRGATCAEDAYIGPPFRVNRLYAERCGDRWVILSAKYGFVPPDFLIPGPYNVTFSDESTHPIGVSALRDQIGQQGLDQYETIIGLGSREYASIIRAAFAPAQPTCPIAGLPLGKAMQAVRKMMESGLPFADSSEVTSLSLLSMGDAHSEKKKAMMPDVAVVWQRIRSHAGERFRQILGKEFTFSMTEGTVRLHTTNQAIPKSHFERALSRLPFASTTEVNRLGVRAPSYVYAILMDHRIRRSDW